MFSDLFTLLIIVCGLILMIIQIELYDYDFEEMMFKKEDFEKNN